MIATYQKWSDNLKVQFDERHLLNIKKEDSRNYYLVNAKPELKNGSWIYLFDSGAIFGKGTYNKGYRIGGWQFFHENGLIAQRGFYKNDGSRFHGNDEDAYLWKIYDKKGIEVADQPYNENWIKDGEELCKDKKRELLDI